MPKQLEMFRDAFPNLRRMGVLTAAGSERYWSGKPAEIARRLGFQLVVKTAVDLATIRQSIAAFERNVEAVFVELQPKWPLSWRGWQLDMWLALCRLTHAPEAR